MGIFKITSVFTWSYLEKECLTGLKVICKLNAILRCVISTLLPLNSKLIVLNEDYLFALIFNLYLWYLISPKDSQLFIFYLSLHKKHILNWIILKVPIS